MIVRVRVFDEHHTSLGAAYFGSYAEANRFCREARRTNPKEGLQFRIDDGPTPRTKAAVIKMLQHWAHHADNG